MNTQQKKMFKVLSPVEKKGGGTYWMRLGTAFTNRDDSLNLYLDAFPATNPTSHRYELHIREFTEEDHRRRETYASSRASSRDGDYTRDEDRDVTPNRDRDFNLPSVRDLGGLGGGPSASSRAVTAMAGPTGPQDAPF